MRTREKIKVTAVEQFNEFGATNISTIKLSNVMDISPGNYYYYFKSKEHLIRVIWEEDMLPHSNSIFRDKEYPATAKGIQNFVEASVSHVYKYRFFYTELYILQKNDAELLEGYRLHLSQLSERVAEIFEIWEEAGLMRLPEDSDDKKRLMYNMWLIAKGWIGYSQSYYSKMSAKRIKEEVILQIRSLFIPALTPAGKKQLEELRK